MTNKLVGSYFNGHMAVQNPLVPPAPDFWHTTIHISEQRDRLPFHTMLHSHKKDLKKE